MISCEMCTKPIQDAVQLWHHSSLCVMTCNFIFIFYLTSCITTAVVMFVERWPDLGDNEAYAWSQGFLQMSSDDDKHWARTDQVLLSNLGQEEGLTREEKEDNGRLPRRPRYGSWSSCESYIQLRRALKRLLKWYMKPVILGYGS